MQINKHHGSYNKSRRNGSVQYIVVHYTGGTGSAKNNCIYFAGGNRNASADYFIDPDGSIWEYSDPASGYYTWAVGDGRGKYGITNASSCHIEVVNTGGPFTEAQVKSIAELVSMLRSKFGVPASRVVRHYDASRKQCPAYYVDPARWNQLHARITGGASTAPAPSAPAASKPAATGKLAVDGYWGTSTTKRLQQVLGTPVDGEVWGQYSGNKHLMPNCTGGWKWSANPSGSAVIRAFQNKLGVTVDGIMGKSTIKAIQRRYGVGQDGICGPKTVRAIQTALNNGTL